MVSPSRSLPLTKMQSIVVPRPVIAFTSNTVACKHKLQKPQIAFMYFLEVVNYHNVHETDLQLFTEHKSLGKHVLAVGDEQRQQVAHAFARDGTGWYERNIALRVRILVEQGGIHALNNK
jgi:hypothetical protein